ncbi:MAG: hypothetical protein ACRERC_05355 [Candidatus Binatia bacterium]
MKENEFTWFGKGVTTLGIVALTVLALINISRGEVPHPFAFGVSVIGFTLFLAAKASVLRRRKWITFGASHMGPLMGNMYRLGYWLIAVGVLATFV